MKDNLKGPPLALLQPRARPRVKEKGTVEIAHDGQQQISALEETIQRKRKGKVRDRPAPHDGIPWRQGTPTGKSSFRKRKPANMLRLLKNSECPKGNACDYSHPPECSFHKKKGLRTWEQVGVQACGQGWKRTKETKEFCGCRLNIGSHPSSGGYHFAKIQSERRPSAWSVSDSMEINVTECWKKVPKSTDCLAP